MAEASLPVRVAMLDFNADTFPCGRRERTLFPTKTCPEPGSFAEVAGYMIALAGLNASVWGWPEDKPINFGGKRKDGSWDGLLGLLMDDEMDILSARFFVNQIRVDAGFHWLDPIVYERNGFVTAVKSEELGTEALIKAFQLSAWLGIFAAVLILILVLLASDLADERETNVKVIPTLADAVFTVLKFITDQISFIEENSRLRDSRRTLNITIGFFALLIVSIFKAKLLDLLLIKTEKSSFNNMKELAENLRTGKSIVLTPFLGGIELNSLLTAESGVMYEIRKALEDNPYHWEPNMTRAIEMTQAPGSKYALVTYEDKGTQIEAAHCGLKFIPDNSQRARFGGFIHKKGNPRLRKLAAGAIYDSYGAYIRLIEVYRDRWLASKPKTGCEAPSRPGDPLKLASFVMLAFVFFILSAVGVLLCFLEIGRRWRFWRQNVLTVNRRVTSSALAFHTHSAQEPEPEPDLTVHTQEPRR